MKILGGGDLKEEGIMVRHPSSLGRIEAPLLRGGLGFNLILGVLILLCPFFMLLLFEYSGIGSNEGGSRENAFVAIRGTNSSSPDSSSSEEEKSALVGCDL